MFLCFYEFLALNYLHTTLQLFYLTHIPFNKDLNLNLDVCEISKLLYFKVLKYVVFSIWVTIVFYHREYAVRFMTKQLNK